FKRFEQWRFLVGDFYGRALREATLFLAQSEDDGKRLREMGADEERVEVTGNLKYDAEPPAIGDFGKWLAGEVRRQERWPGLGAGRGTEGGEEPGAGGDDIGRGERKSVCSRRTTSCRGSGVTRCW